MFASGSALATILAILAPLLKPMLEAFGATLNARARDQRAEQNSKDLGAAEVKIETQRETIDAQRRELEAQADAPQTIDDAISRLDEGSA